MANFTKLAATAKRLLDANGRTVTVVKYGNNPQDQDKPWRGRNQYHDTEITGKAAFVPKTQLVTTFAGLDDSGTLREGEYAIFPASDDQGFNLEEFDVIEDRGVVWRIVRTEILAPADTRILYLFEVER